jgi:hypothetical protein
MWRERRERDTRGRREKERDHTIIYTYVKRVCAVVRKEYGSIPVDAEPVRRHSYFCVKNKK